MTLQRVLATIRGRLILVLLSALVGVVAGVGMAMMTPPSYASTATILLRWIGTDADLAISDNMRVLRERAPTYALLVKQPSVLNEAIESSGLELTASELAGQVNGAVPLDSQTIEVNVRSASPEQAATLANASAEALVHRVQQEEQGSAEVDAVVAVHAVTPVLAVAPQKSIYGAVGALLGVLVGMLTAMVMSAKFDHRRPRRGLLVLSEATRARKLGLDHLAWVMMVVATIPWRAKSFYEGGADPVVVVKAGISLLALGISILAYRRASHHHPVPAVPVLVLAAYLAVTMVGGLANGDLSPALVVTTRMVLLIATMTLLVASYGVHQTTRSLVHVLALVAVVGALSGLSTFTGRLRGEIPPLHPNGLAFIAAVVGIWLVAKVLAGRDSLWGLYALLACLGVIFLTGSRGTLVAFALTVVVMSLKATRLRIRTVMIVVMTAPIAIYLVLGTGFLQTVFLRGSTEEVSTLSNRTVAWESALNLDRNLWQTWFGQGLAQKKIDVPGQWWDTQILDSSWISALVQGGNLGVVLISTLVIMSLGYAVFSPRSNGAGWLGLVVLTTVGGILESGLIDGSVRFIVFFVAALGAFGGRAEIFWNRGVVRGDAAPEVAAEQLPAPTSPTAQLP